MIYIWIRKTVDWEDEAAFRRQLPDAFSPKVQAWNSAFTIPYHVFRARIKDIAQRNLARVEDARIAALDEIPDGAIVVPVDDDDWLAPDAGIVLQAMRNEATRGFYWQRTFLELPLRAYVPLVRFVVYTLPRRKRLVWTCSTNNYAMRKDGETGRMLANHMEASAFFDAEPEQVKRLDARLSVMNRTLASQTSLNWKKPGITRGELVRKLRRYRRLYARKPLEDLLWCRPYVEAMRELMDEVRVR